jgi:GntR family transcriptional regulator
MTEPTGVIDRFSLVPFHYQLRKLLEQQIEAGRWHEGEQLPSEPLFSEHYRVSRATVRQALDALEQQGLIRKEKGKGAFVNEAPSRSWLLQWAGGLFEDELNRRGVTVESTVLRAEVKRLPAWASEELQLSPGVQGLALERLRRIDGKLALYVLNYLPYEYSAILPEILRSSTASLYGSLREQCGVEVAGSSRVLEAVPASPLLARRLGVRSQFALVYIQSITRDATGRPVDCSRAWLRTDRLHIAVTAESRTSLAGRVVNHTFVGVPNLTPSETEGSL